jgi:hypothetical protein
VPGEDRDTLCGLFCEAVLQLFHAAYDDDGEQPAQLTERGRQPLTADDDAFWDDEHTLCEQSDE